MTDPDDRLASQIALVGCCGAYCGACPPLKDKVCTGCRIGYDDGSRDIESARCAIKRCCLMEKKVQTCADCSDYKECGTLQSFYAKKGYKYGKYRESLEFIREYGYPAFVTAAASWKRAYGSLDPKG